MVFRGKFSKGCENCRKAKRRCDLGQPSCLRCINTGKVCFGYRDTEAIRILDETEYTRRKTIKSKKMTDALSEQYTASPTQHEWYQIAIDHFFETFAVENSKWEFLRDMRSSGESDVLLESAIQACGLAALSSVGKDPNMSKIATTAYGKTIALVQKALRDPNQRTTDAALVTVALLGCYENILCHDHDSIRSWRAHTGGTAELLKLRGKEQFATARGRMFYRLVRTQVAIDCVWDDLEPPAFLLELEDELRKYRPLDDADVEPRDKLHEISLDLARLRFQMRSAAISGADASKSILKIQRQLEEWPAITNALGKAWQHTILHKDDPPHVWSGIAYIYASHEVASAWNSHRALVIMVSRAQELLLTAKGGDNAHADGESVQMWATRQQITDAICYTIPCQLSRTTGSLDHTCISSMAYDSIWPLFLAATAALGLVEYYTKRSMEEQAANSAMQASWLISRLEFISNEVGVKWADHHLAVLRGEGSPFLESSSRMAKLLLDRDRDPIGSALRSFSATSPTLIQTSP